ncbi:MAG: glycosyltransferase family 2 protein [Candidatus Saelkia tenebricola]|nr:glycosyltransferase family 2 protein [Candidatus Saelkia tenebricola]
MDMLKNISCAVIIPCYNEEENIQECIKRIPKTGDFTEIIVVDDGSTDATLEKAQQLHPLFNNLKLIKISSNKGKGNALKEGFNKATSDILIILDADMSVAPEDLPKFIQPLIENKSILVNGSRFILPMEKGAMNIPRRIGNKTFSFIFWMLSGMKVTDTLCGTKAFLRQDYQKMIWGKCPWGDFDILFNAVRMNLKLVEIPTMYHLRVQGKSKMKTVKFGLKFIITCLLWKLFLLKERNDRIA